MWIKVCRETDLYCLINILIKLYQLIMNINVKNVVDKFFSNNDVTIEGQGPKTFNREGLSISLKTEPMKYFVLLTSNKKNVDWIIHFENESEKPFTDEEKFILFDAVADVIQPDDIVTTEGGVTPGGISALKHMPFHGFEIIGKNSGQHVYWASDRMLDREKFDRWIQHADKDDYKVNNKQMPLTVENTRPVVKVLRKR